MYHLSLEIMQIRIQSKGILLPTAPPPTQTCSTEEGKEEAQMINAFLNPSPRTARVTLIVVVGGLFVLGIAVKLCRAMGWLVY
jgi:hypothetical protein